MNFDLIIEQSSAATLVELWNLQAEINELQDIYYKCNDEIKKSIIEQLLRINTVIANLSASNEYMLRYIELSGDNKE